MVQQRQSQCNPIFKTRLHSFLILAFFFASFARQSQNAGGTPLRERSQGALRFAPLRERVRPSGSPLALLGQSPLSAQWTHQLRDCRLTRIAALVSPQRAALPLREKTLSNN